MNTPSTSTPSAVPPVLPGEEWRPVFHYPGYHVSNLGRVYTEARRSLGAPPRQLQARIPAQRLGHNGYRQVGLYRDGTRRRFVLVHRLVAAAFLGPCPVGKQVGHINGDRACNTVANLRYASPSVNGLNNRTPGTVYHPGWALPWEARVQAGGQPIWSRSFATKDEAVAAARAHRQTLIALALQVAS